MKINATTFASVILPAGKAEHFAWDSELRGFGMRLREGGSRTGVVQYRIGRKPRRVVLGPLTAEAFRTVKRKDGGVVKLGIRELAAQLLAQVRLREDPAAQRQEKRQKAAETFGTCLDLYLEIRRQEDIAPTTLSEIARHLNVNLKPLHGLHIAKADRRAITELTRLSAAAPVQANRTRSSLVKFLKWCGQQGYTGSNPAIFTGRNNERSRERVLALAELASVWAELPAGDFGDIAQLLVLTGQRRDEIADLEWSEVDLDNATVRLPPPRTKNRREHVFPLSVPALTILQRRWDDRDLDRALVFGRGQRGFSGWSQCKARLDAKLELTPWTLHDLRRSFSTGCGDCGVPPHIIAMLINHQSGAKAGVAGSTILAATRRKVAKRSSCGLRLLWPQ